MRLPPPDKVEKLQTALHTKAKESPDYPFLRAVRQGVSRGRAGTRLRRCRANGGSPGVDGQTFDGHRGVRRGALAGRTGGRTADEEYQPQAVRRVYIPKPDGKQRPLGIPTIRDRVVQTAALLVVWSRSSRRTCRPSNTRTARAAAPEALSGGSHAAATRGIRRWSMRT